MSDFGFVLNVGFRISDLFLFRFPNFVISFLFRLLALTMLQSHPVREFWRQIFSDISNFFGFRFSLFRFYLDSRISLFRFYFDCSLPQCHNHNLLANVCKQTFLNSRFSSFFPLCYLHLFTRILFIDFPFNNLLYPPHCPVYILITCIDRCNPESDIVRWTKVRYHFNIR
jgi:hypothetical protein